MIRHPYFFALLLWIPLALITIVPFLGPHAVWLMLSARWYWTTMSPRRHYSGPVRHVIYAFLGLPAIVGSLFLSAVALEILQSFGYNWHVLATIDRVWDGLSMPLAASILGAHTGAHDWINGLLGIQSRWLPSSWWQIAAATAPARIFELLDKSWGVLIPLGSLLYVTLSSLQHVCVAAAIGVIEDAQAKLAKLNAEHAASKEQAVKDEMARIHAGGIPRMSNGKSSALEF